MSLPLQNVVNVSIELTPLPVSEENFSTSLIIGNTEGTAALPPIALNERIKFYSSLEEVGSDFGSTDPEFLAAEIYFSQVPTPPRLAIGAYYPNGVGTFLEGGVVINNDLTIITSISNGGFNINVDGTVVEIENLDFSTITTWEDVATIVGDAIDTATTGAVEVFYDDIRSLFTFNHTSVGDNHTLSFTTSPTDLAVIDIGVYLKTRGAMDGANLVTGINSETPIQGVEAIIGKSSDWYTFSFAPSSFSSPITTQQFLDVAAFVEGLQEKKLFGITSQDPNVPSNTSVADIAYQLKALGYNHTLVVYSSTNPYTVVSVFGRMSTVNFESVNSTITLKFKQLPGIIPENISTTQATTLKSKNCNVYAAYKQGANIFQEGVVCSGEFIDTIWGLDWLCDAIRTAVFNLLYTSDTKVPQTDAGVNLIVTSINAVLETAIQNEFIGPGTWNAQGFGALRQGDNMKGYYVYAQPLSTQLESIRAQRIAPPITIGIKLQGAIHFVDIVVKVNR